MIKTYNNMSISLKISVAFGLIIGLLVLSAGMMLYALRTFETSFTDHRAHVGTMEQARDIEFAIVDLRRNVDAFEQRAGYFAAIAKNRVGMTTTTPRGVAGPAAGA